jgi:single-strand DNA-binding protein
MAEQVSQSLTKGTRVMVSGKVAMQEFETREGAKGSSLECQVDDIGPSLKYATASVMKAQRQQGAPGAQGAPQGYGQQTPPRGAQTPPRPGQGQPQEQWAQPTNGPSQQWATPSYKQDDDTPF